MERFENNLKDHMKTTNLVSHPNFDRMWSSIQQNELKVAGGETIPLRPRRRKRIAIITGISVALMATPVYAALNYDWSNLLSYRAGIQSALEQGLGQTIEQSVTRNGITLTVHTAFIDENRTFLLYSLDPGSTRASEQVTFDHIGLKDKQGNSIEGLYFHQWNEELGVFQGYFETDWATKGEMADVEFMMENIRFTGVGKQSINYDPQDPKTQVFPIQKDGIDSVTLQSFEPAEGEVLLRSAITFTDPEIKSRGWLRVEAVNDKKEIIKETQPSIFGTPGPSGEYLSQQIFKSDLLRAEGTGFQLAYDRTLETAEGTWSLNMALSKKQMDNGTFKETLNIPVDQVPGGTKIHEMIVTPTQVRLILTHEKKYTDVPYMDYQLDVGGNLLSGSRWNEPGKTELRFEMTGLDAASLAKQPISLIAKHRVDNFAGDKSPIRLTDISAKHQTLTSNIAGYPITWTYYMKDHDLYVESLSSDPAFGGVKQTYYLDGEDRNYGMPAIDDLIGLIGDGSNKRIDVYENFDKTELEVYVSKYTTHKRDDVLHIPLKAEK